MTKFSLRNVRLRFQFFFERQLSLLSKSVLARYHIEYIHMLNQHSDRILPERKIRTNRSKMSSLCLINLLFEIQEIDQCHCHGRVMDERRQYHLRERERYSISCSLTFTCFHFKMRSILLGIIFLYSVIHFIHSTLNRIRNFDRFKFHFLLSNQDIHLLLAHPYLIRAEQPDNHFDD